MNTALILFPGTNRENDMAHAIERETGKAPEIIWHKEDSIGNPDLIILPGGFSYGDYLRCGAIAAHSPIMKDVINKVKNGTPLFGVCNGFQMLIETGLLPGALLHNKSLKFICKQVHLKSEANGDVIKIPVAHGEGNYFADDKILKSLNDNDQIAYRYCDAKGQVNDNNNPNGSTENIAGIYNKEKTILGMMPHPENAVSNWHDNQSGQSVFKDIIERLT